MSSIHEVAKQAGVSPATVSRTFRTPDLLSHQTRRRVLDVAARLNYVPRPHGGRTQVAEASAVSDALGFLFFASDHDSNQINEFYAPMLGGAQAEAGRLGMHLIVRTTPRYERPPEMPQMFREQAAAGTLLVGAAPPEVLAAFDTSQRPCVLLDNRDRNGEGLHDSILSDGFAGAMASTSHLLALGHRRIAFVYNEPNAPSFQDRRRGYLCALWEAGVAPDPAWIISMMRREPLEPLLAALLSGPDAPTAVVAANDWNAFMVTAACRAQGLSIPEDISVVGFDDISFSAHSYPPLTTVRVDKEQMGRLAVRRLLARIEESRAGAPPMPPTHLVVPTCLVVRESCAPPRP